MIIFSSNMYERMHIALYLVGCVCVYLDCVSLLLEKKKKDCVSLSIWNFEYK